MKNKLLRKIWLTRKSRIILSDRLRSLNEFYSFLNIYYSIIIISLSIWNLDGSKESGILLLISSTSIGIYFVFINGKNYLERSIILRNHYIELGDLYSKLDNNLTATTQDILEVEKTYNALLKNIENHDVIDYQNALKCDPTEYNKLDKLDKFCIFFKNSWNNYLIKFILLMSPLLVIKIVVDKI